MTFDFNEWWHASQRDRKERIDQKISSSRRFSIEQEPNYVFDIWGIISSRAFHHLNIENTLDGYNEMLCHNYLFNDFESELGRGLDRHNDSWKESYIGLQFTNRYRPDHKRTTNYTIPVVRIGDETFRDYRRYKFGG